MNNIKRLVAIGGVGGSGTRALSKAFSTLGFSIGEDINDSLDNLYLTYFFKIKGVSKISDIEFKLRVDIFLHMIGYCYNVNLNLGAVER